MAYDDPAPRPTSTALAKSFKALGDTNRLRAFSLLAARGRMCVGDLVTVLDLPQSSVSRHLAALKEAALVDAHREGTWVHYTVAAGGPCQPLIAALATVVVSSEALAEDASRAASLAAAGGCCPQHPLTTPTKRGGH